MKIKVWTDSNNRLLHWAYADENRPVGPTDEGFEVIEVDDAVGLYENHASVTAKSFLILAMIQTLPVLHLSHLKLT